MKLNENYYVRLKSNYYLKENVCKNSFCATLIGCSKTDFFFQRKPETPFSVPINLVAGYMQLGGKNG